MSYAVLPFRNLSQGMDASSRQDIVTTASSKNFSVYKAVNATNRRGAWRQRPGFIQLLLKFPDPDRDYVRKLFESGRFQGAHRHKTADGNVIISVHSGRILVTDPVTRQVSEIKNPNGQYWFNHLAPHCWFAEHQCGPRNYLIINDGYHPPVFIDGLTARYSYTNNSNPPEYPTGSVMASCGRLLSWADPHRYFIFHGDRWSASNPANDLTNQVSQYFANDGAHGAPLPLGRVTGMTPMPVLDTGSGYGPLLVAYEEGWITINLNIERNLWPTSDVDIVRAVTMRGIGNQSPSGIAIVNADVFFWDRAGLRSLSSARQDSQSKWTNTPLSREVDIWLDPFSKNYSRISVMLFQDRLLSAAIPKEIRLTDEKNIPYQTVVHEGLLVMDFYKETAFTRELPVWDGLWTGVRPNGNYSLVQGRFNDMERGFIFGRLRDGRLALFEIREDAPFDAVEVNNDIIKKRIPWFLETHARGINERYFDGSETVIKIENGYMNLSRIHGNLDVRVEFSPNIYPEFFLWREFGLCGQMTNCDVSYDKQSCDTYFENFRESNVSNIVLGKPEENEKCSQHLGRKVHEAEKLRFRLSFDGAAQLDVFDVFVSKQPRAEKIECVKPGCMSIKVCEQNDFQHDILEHKSLP